MLLGEFAIRYKKDEYEFSWYRALEAYVLDKLFLN